MAPYETRRAQVAELVDALVSGTSGESRGGSSPLLGTIFSEYLQNPDRISCPRDGGPRAAARPDRPGLPLRLKSFSHFGEYIAVVRRISVVRQT